MTFNGTLQGIRVSSQRNANGYTRVRHQVNFAAPINFPAESARLQALIKQYDGLPDMLKDDQSLFVH